MTQSLPIRAPVARAERKSGKTMDMLCLCHTKTHFVFYLKKIIKKNTLIPKANSSRKLSILAQCTSSLWAWLVSQPVVVFADRARLK